MENDRENRISDLHVWAVGPGIFAAEIAVVTAEPEEVDHYCRLLPDSLELVHVTVEIHRCPGPD